MADNGVAQLLTHHKWIHATARLVEAYRDLGECHSAAEPMRLGWVTTWNARCGIATYSEHLVTNFPEPVTILANQEFDRLSDEQPNVVRCWRQSKHFGHLHHIVDEVVSKSLNAIVIQFNYAFFNHEELSELIRNLDRRGIAIILMLHSTNDPVVELPGSELFRIKNALALADRLLVHSVADLNRLKAIGLVENVALFPHGILLRPDDSPRIASASEQIIGTYGFALPHKGLIEVLHAVALLRQRGRNVRLKMVNAEYPLDVSRNVVRQLKAEAARLKIESAVEFYNEFLTDEESLHHLRGTDLIVFAYQNTGESASGAVRYGLSAGRPVAVTPLAIFDDIGEAAFRFSETSIDAIANGLETFLDEIGHQTAPAVAINEKARTWREQHDYVLLGKRLSNMAQALVQDRAIERRTTVH